MKARFYNNRNSQHRVFNTLEKQHSMHELIEKSISYKYFGIFDTFENVVEHKKYLINTYNFRKNEIATILGRLQKDENYVKGLYETYVEEAEKKNSIIRETETNIKNNTKFLINFQNELDFYFPVYHRPEIKERKIFSYDIFKQETINTATENILRLRTKILSHKNHIHNILPKCIKLLEKYKKEYTK